MKIELEKTGRYSFPMGVMDIAVTKDDHHAYAACMDGLYELEIPDSEAKDAKPKPAFVAQHGSYVSGVGLLEEDRELVSTSYDGTIQIRPRGNDPSMPPRFAERLHSFWSWRMAVSRDRKYIASVSGQYLAGAEDYTPLPSPEPTVKLLESKTGRTIHQWNMLPSVQCVAFDPSNQYVAAGNLMGDLAVWEIATGNQLASWRTKSFTSWGIIKSHCYISGIFAVSFSPDSKTLYAAGMGEMRDPMAGNGKQLWQRFDWSSQNPEKIQESKSDQTGEGLMEALAWHPNGELLVMAGRLRGGNWNLGIFEASSGNLVGQAKTGMRISSVRFSENGETLYLGGMQGQPKPKEGTYPDFGYIERYRVRSNA